MRVVSLTVLLALSTLAPAAEPWEGIWAAETDWCQHADKIGWHDPAPIKITASRFLSLENACDITRAEKVGQLQAWIIDLGCSGEGRQYEVREIYLMPRDDRLLRFTMDAFVIEMRRCAQD